MKSTSINYFGYSDDRGILYFFHTEIWSMERSVWMKGPHLIRKDQELFSYTTFQAFIGIALNRT